MTDHHTSQDRVTDGPLLDLHDQLVAAIQRQNDVVMPLAPTHRRRPSTKLITAAAAAVVALVVATGVLVLSLSGGRSDVAADVTVQRQGDTVTVSIEDDVTVAEIEQALLDTGVDVTVVPISTGPSRVNRFVGLVGPATSKLVGGDGTTSNKATFVKGSKVELQLGVLGTGIYDAGTVAWSAGEGLAGTSLVGSTYAEASAEIARRAEKSGVTVTYWNEQASPVTPGPDDRILNAQGIAVDRVIVTVGPPA